MPWAQAVAKGTERVYDLRDARRRGPAGSGDGAVRARRRQASRLRPGWGLAALRWGRGGGAKLESRQKLSSDAPECRGGAGLPPGCPTQEEASRQSRQSPGCIQEPGEERPASPGPRPTPWALLRP